MALYENISDLVGNTPLVRLAKLDRSLPGNVYAKLESFNPMSSVKDRIGLNMINSAHNSGDLKPGATIVEATSGNTGIALAFLGAAKGYQVVLTMPDTMSIERRKLLASLGAQLILTPGNQGMKGAVSAAKEYLADHPNSYMPSQFTNPANPQIHEKTTGPEIWKDLDGKVDVFVSGVGTGGTITGVGRYLKSKNKDIHIIAVEPQSSAVLSGGNPGPHKIQGIGAGFIPEVLDKSVVDEILTISNESAGEGSRTLAKSEGILAGISAGANVHSALKLAAREEFKDKNIVTVICDTGERYLSTWLFTE